MKTCIECSKPVSRGLLCPDCSAMENAAAIIRQRIPANEWGALADMLSSCPVEWLRDSATPEARTAVRTLSAQLMSQRAGSPLAEAVPALGRRLHPTPH
jgi:hypothetical protein